MWKGITLPPPSCQGKREKPAVCRRSNATINRELELLRRALRLAHDRQLLPKIPKAKTLDEQNVRHGFFERPDLEAVVAALPAYLRDFTRFPTSRVGGRARSSP
jgi:hypothetical protein